MVTCINFKILSSDVMVICFLFDSSCSKELGQWDLLMEFGKTKGHTNPFLGKHQLYPEMHGNK